MHTWSTEGTIAPRKDPAEDPIRSMMEESRSSRGGSRPPRAEASRSASSIVF